MSRRFLTRFVPVAFTGVVALTGCGGTTAKVAPTEIVVSDFAVAAPTTIAATMASFNVKNTGKEAHQAALVRLDSGKTFADFQEAMKSEGKGPPPAWLAWMGGALVFPGVTNDFTIDLQPGTYVWYCVIPSPDGVPHIAKGMMAPMTVTAATGATVAAPTADIEVSMKDYDWEMSKTPTVGKHVLKISNSAGAQAHEMVIIKLPAGKTAKDFLGWVEKMEGPPPADQFAGVAGMQAGQTNYTTVDFTAGNYALICFVPDMKDGQPHAMHGMVKEFTVQ